MYMNLLSFYHCKEENCDNHCKEENCDNDDIVIDTVIDTVI